jgi:hypothetical protein
MGITDFSVQLLTKVINEYHPKTVCELGDQNLYTNDGNYGQYANLFYEQMGIEEYVCIDLNGGNGALQWDMGKSQQVSKQYDLVTDFGFSEHVGANGKFDNDSIYRCWLNKHNLLKVGGIMVNENPAHNHWPGHGFNYYTENFYQQVSLGGYEIKQLGFNFAMGNVTDGGNIHCIMKKTSIFFPSWLEFKTFSLFQK